MLANSASNGIKVRYLHTRLRMTKPERHTRLRMTKPERLELDLGLEREARLKLHAAPVEYISAWF